MQPLSYQVATGALSPGEVAYRLRAVFERNRNVRVLLAEIDRFDLERREVVLGSVGGLPAPEPVPYDTLIVAGGSHYSYFGDDDWSAHPAEVESLESALTVRSPSCSSRRSTGCSAPSRGRCRRGPSARCAGWASRRCSAAPSSTSTRPASRSRTRTARRGASRREPSSGQPE